MYLLTRPVRLWMGSLAIDSESPYRGGRLKTFVRWEIRVPSPANLKMPGCDMPIIVSSNGGSGHTSSINLLDDGEDH